MPHRSPWVRIFTKLLAMFIDIVYMFVSVSVRNFNGDEIYRMVLRGGRTWYTIHADMSFELVVYLFEFCICSGALFFPSPKRTVRDGWKTRSILARLPYLTNVNCHSKSAQKWHSNVSIFLSRDVTIQGYWMFCYLFISMINLPSASDVTSRDE